MTGGGNVEIRTEQIEQTLVVSIVGSIDALTADELASFLRTQVEGGQAVLVLDLGQVDFMSSAGLRLIMDILKRSREGAGDLRLAAAQPGVERTLEMSGLTRILKAYPSVDEAVASFDA
jgi:anti-anti-sigma factor